MLQDHEILVMMIMTSLMMLVMSSFFIYVVIRSQRKISNKQLEMFNAVIDAQEREQVRIARDLHDQIGPVLSIIRSQLDVIDESGLDDIDKGIKKDVQEHLAAAMNDVRSISHNLIPKTFSEYGFLKSLEYYIIRLKDFNKIQVTLECQFWPNDLGHTFEITLFRILQELFQNTCKHAKASEISLQISITSNVLTIKYSDNGIGLHNLNTDSAGIGIKNIKSRTQLLGGEINLESTQDGGFSALFNFNLKNAYGTK
jgi:signal transduction histidine kinase